MKIDTNADYFKREEGTSSTSKYIQTKVPNETGELKAKEIKGLPDQKIIAPNLKKAACTTFSMAKSSASGLLASLLAAIGVPALKKSPTTIEIKEQAPDFAKSEYGFIQVKETKGGFVEITDNTKGNERTMKLHPSGSYNQTLPDGSIQDKITGKKVLIIDKDWNVVVGNDFVEVVSGNNRIQISKDNFVNINGNSHINIDNDSNTIVGKDMNLNVKGSLNEKTSKSKTVDVTGDCTEKVSKNSKEEVQGNKNITAGKSAQIAAGGSLHLMASGNIVLAGGSLNMLSNGASVSIRNGRVDINGPFYVNGYPYGVFNGRGFSSTPDMPIDENSGLY